MRAPSSLARLGLFLRLAPAGFSAAASVPSDITECPSDVTPSSVCSSDVCPSCMDSPDGMRSSCAAQSEALSAVVGCSLVKSLVLVPLIGDSRVAGKARGTRVIRASVRLRAWGVQVRYTREIFYWNCNGSGAAQSIVEGFE